jgi:ElaB/YqjD/DUF883 family membrane-anchored ribosome-binding protein
MSLPKQEPQESYTYDELQHVVAREVMKHRLSDLEVRLASHETSSSEIFADIRASLKTIEQKLSGVRQEFKEDMDDCRKEFREEVHQEMRENYTHQREMSKMENRLDTKINAVEHKVDRNWIKVTTAVAVVFILFEYAFKFFSS